MSSFSRAFRMVSSLRAGTAVVALSTVGPSWSRSSTRTRSRLRLELLTLGGAVFSPGTRQRLSMMQLLLAALHLPCATERLNWGSLSGRKHRSSFMTQKRAYEKLEKDVRKGLQDVGVDAKEDPLWTTLKELAMSIMNEKRDVDHVLSWKELPDGSCLTGAKYDEFIQGSGNRAVKLEDQVAGIKGQLSARLARSKRTT
ncbi:unnamed protein product [Durusdinium trenchii]|uniref:Uncharacterized protein n=1 Tax=Durusdinium trenchii TaxID=1381693 RepID=A0ABP0HLN9_9DINO